MSINVPGATALAAMTTSAGVVAYGLAVVGTGPDGGIRLAGIGFLAAVALGAVYALPKLRRRFLGQLEDEADRLAELAGLGHLADWPVPAAGDHEAHLASLLRSLERDDDEVR